MRIFGFLLCVFFVNFVIMSESSAYLTQNDTAIMGRSGGHEEITDWSIDALKYVAALKSELDIFYGKIRDGSRAEDEAMLGVVPKSYNHFYPKAATYGQGLYDEARDTYSADKAAGWEKLGHVIHLAQDMTCPSHANDAWHMWHTFHQMGYEWWVASNWGAKVEPLLRDLFLKKSNICRAWDWVSVVEYRFHRANDTVERVSYRRGWR